MSKIAIVRALAKQRLGRMRADAFVIALGLWRGLTVVTAESRRGPEKIPNIRAAKGIDCISTLRRSAGFGPPKASTS